MFADALRLSRSTQGTIKNQQDQHGLQDRHRVLLRSLLEPVSVSLGVGIAGGPAELEIQTGTGAA
jgi:hypothetical protein